MKSVQLALKTSFQLEPDRITRYPFKLDSITPLDLVQENSQKAEEFSIDDLLDFSNDELFQVKGEEEHQTPEDAQQAKQQKISHNTQSYATVTNNSSVTDDFSSITLPAEDLENLEWLSQFVEDSFCEYSVTCSAPKSPPSVKAEQNRPVQRKDVLVTPVQTKARSKRTRSGSYVWQEKKLKEKGGVQQQPRRCSHCGVQKTPQWRAGPLGSKTLCNACGVRFKSGRLLPEYRPACSPTFSYELHSNSHRKVLEMRRKKEVATPVRSLLRN